MPDRHCRVGKIKFKRRTRYRAVGIFNTTTNALRAGVARQAALKGIRG